MAPSRREQTTEQIRAAALAEFTSVGARELTLRKVANRAYVSNGAVYQRWATKPDCIRDLISADLPRAVDSVAVHWEMGAVPLEEIAIVALDDPVQLEQLRFIAECILATRDDDTLEPVVRPPLEDLVSRLNRGIPDSAHAPAIGWWCAGTLIAHALLRTSGCAMPENLRLELVSILSNVPPAARRIGQVFLRSMRAAEIEELEQRIELGDETSAALIAAAQRIVDEEGIDEADARRISSEAGVTTGALYRRFTGTSEILATAFQFSLDSDRYRWTEHFIASLAQEDFAQASRMLATYCRRIWTDRATANALLEYTIAAHADPVILYAVLAEMTRVAEHRTALFTALIAAGAIDAERSPDALAWTLQVPTVGMRLMACVGMTPTDDELERLLAAYLVYLLPAPAPE